MGRLSRVTDALGLRRSIAGILVMAILVGMGERMAERFLPLYMVALGSGRIVNIKAGRVGGYTSSIAIHDFCQARGVPVWCGGMLEAGIGRAHNIALASLPNFVLPGDVSASKRYWKQDIVHPAVETTPHGTIALRDGVDHILAVRHLAKNRVLAGEPFRVAHRDKELRPVRVRTGVRHRE